MIRFLGAGLILSACTFFAVSKTKAMRNRIQTLLALIDALHIIRSEITTNLTPISEILNQLETHKNTSVCRLFSTVNRSISREGIPYFGKCWSSGVEQCCTELTFQERDALCALGNVLGKYSAEEECAAIDRCIATLESGYAAAKEKYADDAKLYTGVSMVTGLMLVILLI